MKGKKRVLRPPLSFFSEGDVDEEFQTDEENRGQLIPRSISNNYKNEGLLLVDHDPVGALSIWQRGIIQDTENYLVRDLIAQTLLSLDELLPAIKSAEEVIRIAPGWADGYVTLARAQREFGEPELALDNLKTARSIFHKRSSNENQDLFEEYPSYPFDSSLEEIQLEFLEIEGIVVRLEERRRQYLLKQEENGTTTKTSSFCVHKMEICQICTTQPENAEIQDHQLRRCLHNLSGRVRVVKDVNVIPHDGGDDEDPTMA